MAAKDFFLRKAVYIPCSILLIYTLAGFFLLPYLGKNILQDQLSKTLGRETRIEKISINPFALTAQMDGLIIKEKEGDIFVSLEKAWGNLSVASIFTLSPVISGVSVENFFLNLRKNEDGTFNFSDFMPLAPKKTEPGETTENQGESESEPVEPEEASVEKEIIGFVLQDINIMGGEIRFEDKSTGVTHRVRDFSLVLPWLSSKENKQGIKSKIAIHFAFNDAKFEINGESAPFTENLESHFDIKINNVDTTHYLPYLPIPKNLVVKSLGIELDCGLDFERNGQENSLTLEGRIAILNAVLHGNKEKIIAIPSLIVNIMTSDILAGQINISKILVADPTVNLKREKNGELSILALIPKTEPKGKNKKSASINLQLADVEIRNGRVHFKDLGNKKTVGITVSPLQARIKNLNIKDSISGDYTVSFKTGTKEKFDSAGRFQTGPVTAKGSIRISDVLFKKYAPYYEPFTKLDIQKGGMDLDAGFAISEKDGQLDIILKNQAFFIRSLEIHDPASREKMIHIPELKISDSTIDVSNRKIDTGTIAIHDGSILLKRLKDGDINILAAALPPGQSVKKAGVVAGGSKKQSASKEAEKAGDNSKQKPWSITIPGFSTKGLEVVFKDLTNKAPAILKLSDIAVNASGIETTGKRKADIDVKMRWNKEGRIIVKGGIVPSTLDTQLDIDIKKLDIASLQPYFTDTMNILVTDGNINARGKIRLDPGKTSKTLFTYTGDAWIDHLITLDKTTSEKFFTFNSLFVSGVNTSLFPVLVDVKDISLTDFYSRIVINDRGDLNLKSAFVAGTEQKKEDTAKSDSSGPSPQIRVANITLQGGDIQFSDYLTKPAFTAGMKEITGSVSGLSTDPASKAKLHLQGTHGQSSPLNILGELNPLAKEKYVDIHLTFTDIELTNFTPYSSKYLGYKIEKGKLILDLEYKIMGNTLESQNRVRLDNFNLGEKVKSEKASSLPIGLAISLLKDGEGQINLDLPVTGKLDDPEFKIGSVVFKMIGNLILKVVTSPFSVIGAMFGGGEELAYMEFEYGEERIIKSQVGKMDKLAEILKKKPSINLDIKPEYDGSGDGKGLRRKQFVKIIKSAKLKEMIASGSKVTKLENVVIKPNEIDFYVPAAYAEAQFAKPKDEEGNEKALEIKEKKKLLMTHIRVNKNDLRLLAMNRSENIKAYLTSKSGVKKERIFLLEPSQKKEADNKKTNTKKSMVKFILK